VQTLYRFIGGPTNGAVGVADREPSGDVSVRGRQLVDARGTVIGRVIQSGEDLPPALAAQANGHTTPAPAQLEAEPLEPVESPAPQFPDEKTWRAAVKAWAVEQGMVDARKRGRLAEKIYVDWRREFGHPEFTS
jgi:hypothetical protein